MKCNAAMRVTHSTLSEKVYSMEYLMPTDTLTLKFDEKL